MNIKKRTKNEEKRILNEVGYKSQICDYSTEGVIHVSQICDYSTQRVKETFSSLLVQKARWKTLLQNTFLPFWTGKNLSEKFRLRPDYLVKSGRKIRPDFVKKSGKSGSGRIPKTLIRYIPTMDQSTSAGSKTGWNIIAVCVLLTHINNLPESEVYWHRMGLHLLALLLLQPFLLL